MAFAAVISLKHTIHRLKNLTNFPRISNDACDEELDSLITVLRGLDDESSRLIDRSVIHELDAKIRDAVWKVEDVLDISSYHCLNISASEGGLDEKGVEQEMNSFFKKVEMFFINHHCLNISASQGGLDEKMIYQYCRQKPFSAEVEDVLDKSYQYSLNISSQGVEEEMNSFLKTVKILREEYDRALRQNPLPAEEEEEYATLSLRRMRREYLGMAGIGKTHLAAKEEEEEEEYATLSLRRMRREYRRELRQKPLPAEEEEALSLSGAVPPVNSSTTVGLSDLSQSIIDQLLDEFNVKFIDVKLLVEDKLGQRQERINLSVVSVVGMAGIGKTHLAALISHHPRIVQHFHVRLWLRLGPKYQASDIYADVLSQLLHQPRDLFKEDSEHELIDLIESTLIKDQSYLIVLDDIWTTRILNFFKGLHLRNTQFLITTRLQEVTKPVFHKRRVHQMPFLNNEESWNLLRKNVFVAENSCSPQLERAGRKIAERCEGLPLLILAVADILRGLEKTEEYWMKVAENKTTTFTDAYENIYEVLLSSYEYLPQHLKPCFLYMGVFPQSCQIRSSKLSNLWAVEDFYDLKSSELYNYYDIPDIRERMLDQFAVGHVKDLVSKSLAIVCKEQRFPGLISTDRKIKSLKLHCAYWYVCVKEARKSNFLHVLNKLTDVYEDSIEKQRRLSVQNKMLLGLKEVYDTMAAATSTTRSLLCTGEDHQYPVRICFDVMLLMRVLDALAIRFYEFPNEVVKLLQLRYLSLTHNGELPSSINNLRQLQFLILRRHHHIKFLTAPTTYLPDEIWDMEELKHLRIMGNNLPDPREGKELSELLTLYVDAHSCSEAVFRGIPNLKKLRITIELEPDAAAETVRCLEHIGLLKRLESLKCVVVNPRLKSSQLGVAPPDHLSKLPRWLMKLSLNGLGYSWKDMTAIASLPMLQVLKLRCSAFQGPHWVTQAGPQFTHLEFLLLEDIDLVHWTAEDNSFRRLRQLSVRHCYKLKKIPSEIGDIRILQMMEVDDCSPSVVDSALQIKEKRNSDDFKLVINSSWNL